MALVHTRVELIATELEEEKRRLLGLMVWGAVAVLLGCFGLVFLAVFATVWLWDDHRLVVLGLMTAVFLGLAAAAVWQVRRRLQPSEALLAVTIAELAADRDALAAAAGRAGSAPASQEH